MIKKLIFDGIMFTRRKINKQSNQKTIRKCLKGNGEMLFTKDYCFYVNKQTICR